METSNTETTTFQPRLLQYEVYKGLGGKSFGAMQFNLIPPKLQADIKDSERGFVLIEAAPPLGDGSRTYDWKNKKITFALGLADIGKMLIFLRTGEYNGKNQLSLVHDPGQGSERKGQVIKTLTVSAPDLSKGVMMYITMKKGEEELKHTIPFSTDEVVILGTLLQAAVSRILGWAS